MAVALALLGVVSALLEADEQRTGEPPVDTTPGYEERFAALRERLLGVERVGYVHVPKPDEPADRRHHYLTQYALVVALNQTYPGLEIVWPNRVNPVQVFELCPLDTLHTFTVREIYRISSAYPCFPI